MSKNLRKTLKKSKKVSSRSIKKHTQKSNKVKYSFGQTEYLSVDELQSMSDADARIFVNDITEDFRTLLDSISKDPVYIILSSMPEKNLSAAQQDYIDSTDDLAEVVNFVDSEDSDTSPQYLLQNLQSIFQDRFIPLRDVFYESADLFKQ